LNKEKTMSTNKENTERTTSVRVGITRTLNTAQYENLQISLHTEDEIKWSDIETRKKKIDGLTKLLTDKFAATQSTILSELGVSEKAAWFKKTDRSDKVEVKSDDPEPENENVEEESPTGEDVDDLFS
jgi:hypothetical protein